MTLKTEYLYLLQVIDTSKFKIGITTNMENRLQAINKSLKKNEVVVISKARINNAKKKEKFLHDLFECSRFTFLGSGKTEYFHLNWLEVIFVMIWVWWFKWRIWVWLILILGVSIFFYLINN